MAAYGKELFKGTASYYSRYRPMYSASLIRFLVERFSLDGRGKMLDLGCGTGQLAFRFSDWFEEIVGIDTEPEMIKEAIRLSKEIRVENVEWFNGAIDTYKEKPDETFHLVTIAKAFHWMDRAKVLETLYEKIAQVRAIVECLLRAIISKELENNLLYDAVWAVDSYLVQIKELQERMESTRT